MTKRHTLSAYSPDRLLRLLFIIALLLSQFSLLEHQLDIQHHADGKKCSICLASPGLNHALSVTFLPPPVRAVVEPPFSLAEILVDSCTPVRRVARSPPPLALPA